MRRAIHLIPLWILVLLISACNTRPHRDRLPQVGAPVPAFDLPMLDGTRATPASIAGAPALVALWSSDCGASRLALQALARIEKDYAPLGVRVLVLADDAKADDVRASLAAAKVNVPVAYASGSLDDLFDGDRRAWEETFPLPSFLVLDTDGRVAQKTFGVPLDEAQRGSVRLQHVRDAIDAVRTSKH